MPKQETDACEQKIRIEKANFCSNTMFSLYFKIREKIHIAKAFAFSLHFLFRRDQDHFMFRRGRIIKMDNKDGWPYNKHIQMEVEKSYRCRSKNYNKHSAKN